jgi:hypothetical protein
LTTHAVVKAPRVSAAAIRTTPQCPPSASAGAYAATAPAAADDRAAAGGAGSANEGGAMSR